MIRNKVLVVINNSHQNSFNIKYIVPRKKTREEFIEDAKKVHGDKYDYSKVEYVNIKTKVCIICPIHGEFWQTPDDHISGRGCMLCGIEKNSAKRRLTQEQFIQRAYGKHKNKYDYSKAIYKGIYEKVIITCNKHNYTWEVRAKDLMNGHGCPKCGKESSIEK